MDAVLSRPRSSFDLADDAAYRHWRDAKLARRPRRIEELVVPVADPGDLTSGERAALLRAIGRAGFAFYRLLLRTDDGALPRRLGAQLGLHRLDANWLAGEDGISRIAVRAASDGPGGFIPYTDRAIGWHTDGYYHPEQRRIRGMVLHCVRPARSGGENRLLDPELAYIALRERSPRLVQALMQPDAMTIPQRTDEAGIARAAQSGPVFSLDEDGCLHMRYTARTRSIAWKDDAATREAVAQLQQLLADSPWIWRVRLQAGMGMVGHNVLHDRSAFVDDPARPRLVLRARFLDRAGEAPWPNG
ncbi:TauD/TfdA family dioxygenase [Ramlibacter sp. AN1133]|uniref:TauD/TfdA family dioxygenase n=1 Tax=Ramlibacter sp. AN1133 TaxID=3133429 RepID=UPI0030BB4F15